MKPNHGKTAVAHVALATIAAEAMAAAMVDAGPSLAGNSQHSTQCFGLRDDPIHPVDQRCLCRRSRGLLMNLEDDSESTSVSLKPQANIANSNLDMWFFLVSFHLGAVAALFFWSWSAI